MQLVHVRVMCFMLPTCFLSGPPVFRDAHMLFFAHIIVGVNRKHVFMCVACYSFCSYF